MTDFLNALKADLQERRIVAVLFALGIALIGALAYAMLGGSSASEAPPASPPVVRSVGIAVNEAPSNPNQPVAETTNGSSVQRAGYARNPFAPVPAARLATVTASSTSSSSSSSSSSTSSSSAASKAGSGSSATGESPASTPPKPTKPAIPRVVIHYHVTAQFGPLPPPPTPGVPAPPAEPLKSYENLTVDQPLPDKQTPQLVFLGVVLPAGKSAIFALTGEAILHGAAKCLPSVTQCQAIELNPGQSETFETLDANNNPVTYELKLASITSTRSTASAAKAHAAFKAPSTAQRELLRSAGLAMVPALKGAQGAGMLVSIGHPPRRARARSAVAQHRPAA